MEAALYKASARSVDNLLSTPTPDPGASAIFQTICGHAVSACGGQ
jgi:hypothetical protein